MFLRFPHYRQLDARDCGVTCLRIIAKYYGRAVSVEYLKQLCPGSHNGVSLASIKEAAEQIGFHAVAAIVPLENLIKQRHFPCLLHWNQQHFVVLYDVITSKKGERTFCISDPETSLRKIDEKKFCQAWISDDANKKGIAMLFKPSERFDELKHEAQKKDNALSFLWRYIKRYRTFLLQISVSFLVVSLIQFCFPFLTQAIVDKGIQGKNISIVYLILMAELMLLLSRIAAESLRRWQLLFINSRLNIQLYSDFFYKLMHLPMSFFDSKLKGDLIRRLNDHQVLEQFLSSQSFNTLFSVFGIVIYSIILASYSLPLLLIFMAGSLLYLGWVFFFWNWRENLNYDFFRIDALSKNKAIQLLYGMQEIKLQQCELRKRWEWEDTQADLFMKKSESLRMQQMQEIGGILIGEFKNIVITVFAATSVINGEITLGVMLAVQYIIGQLNSPLEQLIHFVNSWQDVRISIERLSEIRQLKDENVGRDEILPSLDEIFPQSIELSHVTFQYDGKYSPKVLDDFSLNIPLGKTTAIVGESGSGKTTLLKLLLGFFEPTAGTITIGNTDIKSLNLDAWRTRCGTVMQDGYIFSDSIARNIACGNDEIDKERLDVAIEKACLKEMIDKLPIKENTRIGEDGQGLSQGQKQRIMIARAIYKNPDFLFFDEATNSLDSQNEKQIVENISEFCQGRTMIVVAHRLSTVKQADNIVVMKNGRITEMGSHEELVARKSAYYHLIKNQLELES